MGSVVRKGSVVKGVVAAGSVVPEGATVGEGEIWAGNPAHYLRDITPSELQILREHKVELVQLAQIHAEENNKTSREVIDYKDSLYVKSGLTATDLAYQEIEKLNFPPELDDEEFIE